MKVLTSHWRAMYERRNDLDQLGVQPVRISMQLPRYWAASTLCPAVNELAPTGMWKWFDQPVEFRARYLDRLDRVGVDVILEKLSGVATALPDQSLALCCFEVDRAHCHRGLWAQWWAEQTGELIEEWTAPLRQMTMNMEMTND
jgi:hypothetical protein